MKYKITLIMSVFAKIIDYPERNTQIVVKKSTQHGDKDNDKDDSDEFYYTLIVESYNPYPDFTVEPKATFKYKLEVERDANFDSDNLAEKCKKVIDQSFIEIENFIKNKTVFKK